MWMRVGRSRMDPARIGEDSTLLADVAEAYRQLPGFQSVMHGRDDATGRMITVSTFDTEEHAHWSPTREDLNARIRALGIEVGDGPEFYEVTTQASPTG
jgi:heme-degrading monooxygenase HmoA